MASEAAPATGAGPAVLAWRLLSLKKTFRIDLRDARKNVLRVDSILLER
jgi:hypothetical protein